MLRGLYFINDSYLFFSIGFSRSPLSFTDHLLLYDLPNLEINKIATLCSNIEGVYGVLGVAGLFGACKKSGMSPLFLGLMIRVILENSLPPIISLPLYNSEGWILLMPLSLVSSDAPIKMSKTVV
jgi:hypothetical protein